MERNRTKDDYTGLVADIFQKKRKNGLCGFYVFTDELAQQLKCPGFLFHSFFFKTMKTCYIAALYICNCKYILAYIKKKDGGIFFVRFVFACF